MSKPDKIPPDVWAAALAAIEQCADEPDDTIVVARAILAERERCAKACLTYPSEHFEVREMFARLIRKGSA